MSASEVNLRLATADDAAAIAEIYAPIVASTPISFEDDAPTVGEMRARIEKTLRTYPWLVGEERGTVLGYVYASRHRERAAYRWSVEVTAYVGESARGRGIASALYRALFRVLEAQGYRSAFAGIALPNEASAALHRAVGFTSIGVFHAIGYKLGAWHDVSWWERPLRRAAGPPAEPVPLPLLEAAVVEDLIAGAR